MSEVVRCWFDANGASFDALEANVFAAGLGVVGIEEERGHLVALGTLEILQERTEQVKVSLTITEV